MISPCEKPGTAVVLARVLRNGQVSFLADFAEHEITLISCNPQDAETWYSMEEFDAWLKLRSDYFMNSIGIYGLVPSYLDLEATEAFGTKADSKDRHEYSKARGSSTENGSIAAH